MKIIITSTLLIFTTISISSFRPWTSDYNQKNGDTSVLENTPEMKIIIVQSADGSREQIWYNRGKIYRKFHYVLSDTSTSFVVERDKSLRGYMHGEELFFHQNGKLSLRRIYHHDFPWGLTESFDTTGSLYKSTFWDTTSLESKELWERYYFQHKLVAENVLENDHFKRIIRDSAAFGAYKKEWQWGKRLFETNCTSCHHAKQESIGPPLAKIVSRKGRSYAFKYTKNNQEFRKINKQARAIYAEYHEAQMSLFFYLPDEDIYDILDYLESVK